MSGITSMFCIAAVFLMADIQTIFHIKCVVMFVANHHTKFHTASTSGSLVTVIKLKAKENYGCQVFILHCM
jgi:hypothetical protein